MYALVASEGELDGFSMDDADTAGGALLYSDGGGLLLACAWVLLLALLVVLELTRGGGRGALRAVRESFAGGGRRMLAGRVFSC